MRRFLPGEIGRWLVKNQEFSAAIGRAGGCNQLLLANGQVRQKCVGWQGKADIIQNFLSRPHHGAALQQAEPGCFIPQKQVGGNAEMAAQDHFLMHGVDAQGDSGVGRAKYNRLAFPQNLAASANMHAGQQLDER